MCLILDVIYIKIWLWLMYFVLWIQINSTYGFSFGINKFSSLFDIMKKLVGLSTVFTFVKRRNRLSLRKQSIPIPQDWQWPVEGWTGWSPSSRLRSHAPVRRNKQTKMTIMKKWKCKIKGVVRRAMMRHFRLLIYKKAPRDFFDKEFFPRVRNLNRSLMIKLSRDRGCVSCYKEFEVM